MEGYGSLTTTDGRGQIKRLLVLIGMGLMVPFFVYSQTATDTSGVDASPDAQVSSANATTVDESTLIIGETSNTGGNASRATSGFTFWDLVRMVLVLACVVGIIYVIFYLLKRAGGGKFSRSEFIKVVGSQTLPGNKAIYLVQVGSQVFMVGAGSDSMALLGEITEKETVDAMIVAGDEDGSAPRRSFGDLVASLVKGSQDGSINLLREQRERLQRLRQ